MSLKYASLRVAQWGASWWLGRLLLTEEQMCSSMGHGYSVVGNWCLELGEYFYS